MTKEEIAKQTAIEILDEFENYLFSKGVNIPNEQRDEDYPDSDEGSILYGDDYFELEDKVISYILDIL